jgi:hypothetical protein
VAGPLGRRDRLHDGDPIAFLNHREVMTNQNVSQSEVALYSCMGLYPEYIVADRGCVYGEVFTRDCALWESVIVRSRRSRPHANE